MHVSYVPGLRSASKSLRPRVIRQGNVDTSFAISDISLQIEDHQLIPITWFSVSSPYRRVRLWGILLRICLWSLRRIKRCPVGDAKAYVDGIRPNCLRNVAMSQ